MKTTQKGHRMSMLGQTLATLVVGAVLICVSACEMQGATSREIGGETAALETSSPTNQAASAVSSKSANDPNATGGTFDEHEPANGPTCLTDRENPAPVADSNPRRDVIARVSPAEKQMLKQREYEKSMRANPTGSVAAAVPPTPSPGRVAAEREYLRLSESVTDPDEQAKLKRQMLGE